MACQVISRDCVELESLRPRSELRVCCSCRRQGCEAMAASARRRAGTRMVCGSAVRRQLAIWLSLGIACVFCRGEQDSSRAVGEVLIGFGSCLMQAKLAPHESQGYRPYTVLSQLAKHELDSFVFMGDAVYADFPHFYSSGCCSRPPFPTCRVKCFEDGTIGSRAQLEPLFASLLRGALNISWLSCLNFLLFRRTQMS
eukprot:TRINITY_DN5716_c0_g1_i9.p1 TRINITY_DN5716_c0_g1~~TRINITY_DN5716_c0_g1_i9.p1  ORF type:complete len:198 (-),score=29.17 TRINITY_DN5716_c0_g1_i9:45-638(-)